MSSQTHQHWVDVMQQSKYTDKNIDTYNEGPLVDLIEQRICDLLKKPSAMFFNKGTICQLTLLKTVCESKNNRHLAIHPQSHIAVDEYDAYLHITKLNAFFIGQTDIPISSVDLEYIPKKPAVLVIEMPLRRAGFKLAEWQELLRIKTWCQKHCVHLHMDGARLWESAPFYQKSVAEISSLFDSVYVSLYKGIGGLSGALLAGDKQLVESCNLWRNRLGSQMWTNFPALIAGLEGLDRQLPKIHEWVGRAAEVAQALSTIKGLSVETPQTNGFLIHTKSQAKKLNPNMETLKNQYQLSPCKAWTQKNKQTASAELQIGANHALITNEELVEFFTSLLNS